MRQTDNLFEQLLELAPHSAPVMRAYADFLLDVANDPRKAMQLLTAAEQVEDDELKARSQGATDAVDYVM